VFQAKGRGEKEKKITQVWMKKKIEETDHLWEKGNSGKKRKEEKGGDGIGPGIGGNGGLTVQEREG